MANEFLLPGARIPSSMTQRTFVVTMSATHPDELPSENDVHAVLNGALTNDQVMVDVMHAEPGEREFSFRTPDGDYVIIRHGTDTETRNVALLMNDAQVPVYSRYVAHSKNWIRL